MSIFQTQQRMETEQITMVRNFLFSKVKKEVPLAVLHNFRKEFLENFLDHFCLRNFRSFWLIGKLPQDPGGRFFMQSRS